MTSLRIGLVMNSTAMAGTEQHVLTLARGLCELGHDVRVICRYDSPLASAAADVARVAPILGSSRRTPIDIHRLATHCRREKLDVLHAHNGVCTLLAVAAGQLSGVATVATQHFIEPAHATRRGPGGRFAAMIHRRLEARLDGVIAISQAVREAMIARHPALTDRCRMVHNGVTMPEAFELRPIADRGRPEILCVARFEREKAVDTLIQAMSSVLQRLPRARLCLVGGGRLQQQLEAQVDCAGLGEAVRFLGRGPDARRLMAESDLLVLPSPAEPFGLVVAEAMAAARPVVAIDAGGPRELVEHRRTGMLVGPQDPETLADAICMLGESPDMAREFGHAGRQRYLENFTAERMAKNTAAFYHAAIESRREGSPLLNSPPCASS